MSNIILAFKSKNTLTKFYVATLRNNILISNITVLQFESNDVKPKRLTVGQMYNTNSVLRVLQKLLKHTLCLAFHCTYLCSHSPYDQCPHANQEFLPGSTMEQIHQNKSALKHHTYFMILKCSKSKPFWIVELHKYRKTLANKKKMR